MPVAALQTIAKLWISLGAHQLMNA
jgi:hypothetical protein